MFTFRFAPSPNGRLHLGHAYSALLNARMAHYTNGRFLIRLEDIDTTRCTPELAQACLDDLAWLGLVWEVPVRIQSRHFADYQAALDGLKQAGLIYPCFCSRKEVAEMAISYDPDGAPLYSGMCRHLPAEQVLKKIERGTLFCSRLNMAKALEHIGTPLSYPRLVSFQGKADKVGVHPERWGDAILSRKETPTSYHLSVVVDDALQGITHIVRGKDLEPATDLHVLLQALLGLPTPLYYHHELITYGDDDKLSKSKHSESLAALRTRSMTPQQIEDMLPLEETLKGLLA